MRKTALALTLLLACGPRNPPPPAQQVTPPPALRGSVKCGAATCSPDEYCENKCLCCGAYVPDPSQAKGASTCKPLPASCHGANGPECRQRTVDIPCA